MKTAEEEEEEEEASEDGGGRGGRKSAQERNGGWAPRPPFDGGETRERRGECATKGTVSGDALFAVIQRSAKRLFLGCVTRLWTWGESRNLAKTFWPICVLFA